MRKLGRFLIRDSLDELVDPAITAVVIVDLQNDFCDPAGLYARCGKDIASVTAMLPRAVAFVRAAQSLGVRCVFIRQITLAHGRSDTAAWMRFKTRDGKSPEYALAGTWGSELVPGLEAGENDLVVEKLRPDAFHRTALDLLLRAGGIETLVILGTVTEGCVESTVRSASYHDYYTVVVSDCVASPNPVNHEGSMAFYKARYPLFTSDQILGSWRDRVPASREAGA